MTELNLFLKITHSHAEFRNSYKSNPLVGDFLKLNEANVLNRLIDLYVYNEGKPFLIFNTTLATALNCTSRTITNYYRRLKELGYLTIDAKTISDGKVVKKYNFITVNFPKLFQDFGKKLFQDQMPKTISFIWRIIQKAKILYRKIFPIEETVDIINNIHFSDFAAGFKEKDSFRHQNHQLCDEEEDKIPISDYYHWSNDMELCKKWIQIAETDYQFLIEHTNDAYYKFCKFYASGGKGSHIIDSHCGWKLRWDKWLLNTHKSNYKTSSKAAFDRLKQKESETDTKSSISFTYDDNDLNRLIESLDEPEEIKKIRYSILQKVGSAEYYSWFHLAKIELVGLMINLTAKYDCVADRWDNYYKWLDRQSYGPNFIVIDGINEFLKEKN